MSTRIPYLSLLIACDDTTTLPVDVPAYELPILEAPYREKAVQERAAYEVEVEDFNVNDAFERLIVKCEGHAAMRDARIRHFERARSQALDR